MSFGTMIKYEDINAGYESQLPFGFQVVWYSVVFLVLLLLSAVTIAFRL